MKRSPYAIFYSHLFLDRVLTDRLFIDQTLFIYLTFPTMADARSYLLDACTKTGYIAWFKGL